MEKDERRRRAELRRLKRQRQVLIGKIIIGVLVVVIAVLCYFVVKGNLGKTGNKNKQGSAAVTDKQSEQSETSTETQTEPYDDTVDRADRLAAMYDYDGAIALLQNSGKYAGNQEMVSKVAEYEATKATCVEYPLEEVTHVFYHTMIKDPGKAFSASLPQAVVNGNNQYMTTIDEYNKITQAMYEKGYVLVNLSDMATFDGNGTLVKGKIMLPPGKIPFVLSQDDVSYYHSYDNQGYAARLIIDQNGEVKNEYLEDDGTISIGDFDMVPLLDTFVKEHPDFSYHGAKGTLALTGYNGVLGYRTDIAYTAEGIERRDPNQQEWLDKHPDFDFEEEVANAKKVAEAMKANGWKFASHTWGHMQATEEDTEKWVTRVKPIIGETNIMIYPNGGGSDIGGVEPYTDGNTNGRLSYMRSKGFQIFCGVDANKYWVQFGDTFMRQGRRNLDGYRMYYHTVNGIELLEDLFDVNSVFDPARPTPVAEL